jgi:hypothetical protein
MGMAGEILGENLLQCHIIDHKSYMNWPVIKPKSPRWDAADVSAELWHGLYLFSRNNSLLLIKLYIYPASFGVLNNI